MRKAREGDDAAGTFARGSRRKAPAVTMGDTPIPPRNGASPRPSKLSAKRVAAVEPPSPRPASRRTRTKATAVAKAAGKARPGKKATSRAPKTTRPPESKRASGARRARSASPASPPRARVAPTLSAEDLLHRAMTAQTPRARAIWARRGLGSVRRLDRTTQSMLLRQLYLAYYETRRFDEALEISEQNLHLDVLPDVVHQDAARAAQALGDVDGATGHLRLAARVSPAKRRAFHWWTLGSVYFLAGRYADAVSALTRAARWGTTDKPLYQGHLAVARCAGGEEVPELPALLDRLAEVPAGQGYGRFVLGHLAYYAHRWDEARRYLEAFVKRSEGGRVAVAIALDGEITRARDTLESLAHLAPSDARPGHDAAPPLGHDGGSAPKPPS